MKNRVEIARKLLAEDGVMVIQCDDNEIFHLKVLLDEVFKKSPKGKSNFVQMVEVRANEGAANEYQNPFMPKNCEYLLIYAKNYDAKKYKPVWIESHIDSAYSKILLNPQEKDFHKWEVGTVKEEYLKTAIVTKCDNPSCDTLLLNNLPNAPLAYDSGPYALSPTNTGASLPSYNYPSTY